MWDEYDIASLKSLTRAKCESSQRCQVLASAPFPNNWQEILRNNENKKALFCLLAQALTDDTFKNAGNGKHLASTLETEIVSSLSDHSSGLLQLCSYEEANTRMLLHEADLVHAGYRKILLRTVDTDVVVLPISFFQQFAVGGIWNGAALDTCDTFQCMTCTVN